MFTRYGTGARVLWVGTFAALAMVLTARAEQQSTASMDPQELAERLEQAEAEIQRLKEELARQRFSVVKPAEASLYGRDEPLQKTSAPSVQELNQRLSALEERWKNLEASRSASERSDRPTVRVEGRIQVDGALFHQSDRNRQAVGDIEDGLDFRRVRIGARGDAFEMLYYVVEMDFAGTGRPSFTDVYLGARRIPVLGNVQFGHFKEPFSLEELTSGRFVTFMERGLPNAFAPARNAGVMAFDHSEDERWTWALGWFRTDSDEFGDDVGDEGEQAVTGRLTFNPWFEEGSRGVLHLGGAYSYRNSDEGRFRFRERPEIRMRAENEGDVPRFVDTGNIPAVEAHLLGAEAALVWGPFSIQSEAIFVPVNQINTSEDPIFTGAYVFVSYFLTGESRQYNRERGYFERVRPQRNFLIVTKDGVTLFEGFGAWEVAARWSYLDLNDEQIHGGRLHDVTFGVSWYLNPYTRLMFNYIHAFLDHPVFDDSDADIVAMRGQIDF
jgi:phosphate-selective porin OprO/OprP